jgi:predicted aspartyl protease
VRISDPGDPKRHVDEDMLVDSGAIFAIVPGRDLRRIGVRPRGREEFRLADGSVLTRQVGIAGFEYGGRAGGTTVIFGESGDAPVLGALALESMGLMLDPVRRLLRPLPMVA